MATVSIAVTGNHNIEVINDKFMLNGKKASTKDVPFVRYKFDKFGPEEKNYVESMIDKFTSSCHLIELSLTPIDDVFHREEVLKEEVTYISNIKAQKNSAVKPILFLYIDIPDDIAEIGRIPFEIKRLILIAKSIYPVERIALVDRTKDMCQFTADELRKDLATPLGLSANDIAICSSPLSFVNDSACLTAVKARELMAKYSLLDSPPLPSANHQCMDCCGCIKYVTITQDCPMPASERERKAPVKKVKKTDTTKNVKKAPKLVGLRQRYF